MFRPRRPDTPAVVTVVLAALTMLAGDLLDLRPLASLGSAALLGVGLAVALDHARIAEWLAERDLRPLTIASYALFWRAVGVATAAFGAYAVFSPPL